jgi:N,N-dimethylformamidase beta subunit-like, C-terminal/Domain of unknown function (DUF4082)/Bacterial Ig domain
MKSVSTIARASLLLLLPGYAFLTTTMLPGGTPRLPWPAGTAGATSTSFGILAGPCDPPVVNAIVCENSKQGDPSSDWDISGAGDPSIQGFATDISANRGETVSFKIATSATSYRIDIYRLGYYGGLGARRVATIFPSAPLPQIQPSCLQDSPWTGLRDCGNWAVSASWDMPADATSGIYIARPVRLDTGGASHIPFVVRDDDGHSSLLFQTSDTTWQAYNRYGGNDLYGGDGPATNGRAHKLSYNRPFTSRADHSTESLFNAEYPMVRWLEANGYDVSYSTGVDTDRRGAEILEHKVFMSVGHDEYVSAGERANLEAARAAGVHLAFFSGNEIYWKVRWEDSIDGSGTQHRTLVCYKEGTLGENNCGTKCDPLPDVWTGLWRDGCSFSPPADGCRPENALSGQISWNGTTYALVVPADDGRMRFWRDTSMAILPAGQAATLPFGTLGYEWDYQRSEYETFYPPGRVSLSTAIEGSMVHHLTLYRHPSGALVLGAGSVQWSWGLDSHHDRGNAPPDISMQQATVNLFADMGVQPASLQPGLTAAIASTDATPPVSQIYSPLAGSTVRIGFPVNISGNAADSAGGVVGGVEVSVDGGGTWHPAVGRESWTYTWTPAAYGSTTVRSRAVDDSGNLEMPDPGVTFTVGDTDSGPPNVPATLNDSYSIEENTTLDVPAPGVLANDSDPNGDPVIAVLLNGPAHGALTLRPDGSFTYTPTSAFRGNDFFTYRARDPGGNLSAPATATIAVGIACPCSIFDSTTIPAFPHFDDRPVTLGVKIRSDVDGFVTGMRFYKDARDTGTHIAQLWSRTGTLLASATFSETSSGWQQVDFPSPVPIAANTTYVASNHTTTGYPQDVNFFTSSGIDVPPLHALQDGVEGGNGVYRYDDAGGASGFPDQSFQGSNYYVDVVFERAASIRAGLSPATQETAMDSQVTVSVIADLRSGSAGLGSYEADLGWDAGVLEFTGFSGGQPPFHAPVVDASGAGTGSLAFSDTDPSGAQGLVRLVTFTFRARVAPCVTTALIPHFRSMHASGTFEDLLPSLAIDNGSVSIVDYSFNLMVEDPINTILHWSAPSSTPAPVTYDVVRGFLGALSKDSVTIHLGPVACLENNSHDTTTAAGIDPPHPDYGIPGLGQGYFYLVRFHDGIANRSYGFGGQCQLERKVTSGDCP